MRIGGKRRALNWTRTRLLCRWCKYITISLLMGVIQHKAYHAGRSCRLRRAVRYPRIPSQPEQVLACASAVFWIGREPHPVVITNGTPKHDYELQHQERQRRAGPPRLAMRPEHVGFQRVHARLVRKHISAKTHPSHRGSTAFSSSPRYGSSRIRAGQFDVDPAALFPKRKFVSPVERERKQIGVLLEQHAVRRLDAHRDRSTGPAGSDRPARSQ